MEYAFDMLSVRRLDARAAVQDGRISDVLGKLGEVRAGLLRRSFLRNEEHLDPLLWTIPAEGCRQAKVIWGGTTPLQ